MLGDNGVHDAKVDLDDLLVAATHIPLVILAYGGPGVTLEHLATQVGRDRPVLRTVAVPYRLLGPIALEEKNATNRDPHRRWPPSP